MQDGMGEGIGKAVARMERSAGAAAARRLQDMVGEESLAGDLLAMDFEASQVVVHDHARAKIGGIPAGCFLLATRMVQGRDYEATDEDAALILLRVLGPAKLPNAAETDFTRFLAGQRASSTPSTWDEGANTDQFTLNQLRFSGVACKVVGTFRMSRANGSHRLFFGSDVSNFYSGKGMKVYKPVGAALETIVNFSKNADPHPLAGAKVAIGHVRYSSTLRERGPESVDVALDPTDLLARRTALFGMSRTGKSNTTKIVVSRVFGLRSQGDDGRIGQLVIDVNGEYANENTQDGDAENMACLKNVAQHTKGARLQTATDSGDVVTYGLTRHPNDPGRCIVKINFYGTDPAKWTDEDQVAKALEPLLVGKQLINEAISDDSTKYVGSFRNTPLDPPKTLDHSTTTRFQRSVLAYRSILHAAGFPPPHTMTQANLKGLFNAKLIKALTDSADPDDQYAATVLAKDKAPWNEVVLAMKALRQFIADGKDSGYNAFNQDYLKTSSSGGNWHDDRLTGVLALYEYPNGPRSFRAILDRHDPVSATDYAKDIVEDLVAGRLVIFDQSTGDPEGNKAAAERIMWAIFNNQKAEFTNPRRDDDGRLVPPRDIVVYVEEAHNLLPSGSSANVSNVWSRVAKEGSKYRIGLVYATQEPSSIQANILKNTDNFFIAHLNNTDELKEIRKYLDFSDFEHSILRAPDVGFLRMRTLSNPYTVPVQIAKFKATR